ncbi:MAG TPA: hypothetical protein VF773_15365 [Verrucomicrobiae bacterium]
MLQPGNLPVSTRSKVVFATIALTIAAAFAVMNLHTKRELLKKAENIEKLLQVERAEREKAKADAAVNAKAEAMLEDLNYKLRWDRAMREREELDKMGVK